MTSHLLPTVLSQSSSMDSEFSLAYRLLIGTSHTPIDGLPSLTGVLPVSLVSHWFSCALTIHRTISYGFVPDIIVSGTEESFHSILRGLLVSSERGLSSFWLEAFRKYQWPSFLVVSLLIDGMPIDGNDWNDDSHSKGTVESIDSYIGARIVLAQRLLAFRSLDSAYPALELLIPDNLATLRRCRWPAEDSLAGEFLLLPCDGISSPIPVSDSVVLVIGSRRICLVRGVLRFPEPPFDNALVRRVSWRDFSPHAPLLAMLSLIGNQNSDSVVKPIVVPAIPPANSDELGISLPSDSSTLLATNAISVFESAVEAILASSDHPLMERLRDQWNNVHCEFRRPVWRPEEPEMMASLIDYCVGNAGSISGDLIEKFKAFVSHLEQYALGKGVVILPAGVMDQIYNPEITEGELQAEFMDAGERGSCLLTHCGWSTAGQIEKEPVYKVSAGPKTEGFLEFERSLSSLNDDHPLKKVVKAWPQASMNCTMAQDVVKPIVHTLFIDTGSHQGVQDNHAHLIDAAKIALQSQSGLRFQYMSTSDQASFNPDICESISGVGSRTNKIKKFLSPLVLDQDNTIILKAKVELY